MADTSENQLFDIWKKQLEEGTQAWTRLVSQAPPTAPPDPSAFWRAVLDQGLQAWATLFAQSPVSPDLVGQWKQFLDQCIEQALQSLNLPSRSQLTAVAKQIVDLEDRLERIEDTIGPVLRRLEKEPG